MANRGLLHKIQKDKFKRWLESLGYTIHPTKSEYEAIRATHPEKQYPIIVYQKASMKEHFSVMDRDYDLVQKFLYDDTLIKPEAQMFRPEDIKLFNWDELDGKTVTIRCRTEGSIKLVMAIDTEGRIYVIKEVPVV